MGCYTFTYADKKLERTKNSIYAGFKSRCVLHYWGRGFIAKPDGTFIREDSYEGYGMFSGHDIYEVVTEMNRRHLREIFEKIAEIEGTDKFWGHEFAEIAAAYEGGDDEKAAAIAKETASRTGMIFLEKEWKRNIGIALSCEDSHNESLPYPLKVTSTDKIKIPYIELPCSYVTQ